MAEIIVTSTADSGTGTLRAAIAAAQDGDVILFDPVVFPVGATTAIYLSSYITFSKSISIYGGESDGEGGYTSGATITRYVVREVDGVETEVVVDDDHPAAEGEIVLMHVTTRVALDGQAAQDPDAADEWSGWTGSRLISSPASTVATIAGIAFINGLATTSECPPFLHIEGTDEDHGNYSVTDCSFKSGINTAGYCGGVRIRGALARFESCEFDNCKAKTYGGAVYTPYTTTATLDSCVITNCSATSGGALTTHSTSQNTLIDCTIVNCNTTSYGGAIFSTGESQLSLTNCIIANCTAPYGGGIGAGTSSQCNLTSCTITNCSASRNGGALYSNNDAINTLTDCTITDCVAASGGGVFSSSTSQNILNDCTLTNCTATAAGAAIYSAGTTQNTLNNCDLGDHSNYVGVTSVLICNTSTLGTVNVASNASLMITGGVTILQRLVTNKATIDDGAALTITDSATFSTGTQITSEGRGYLAVAPGIDVSAATLTNVVACRYGAGISALRAYKSGSDAVLETTVENENVPFLIETRVGEGWETVTTAGTPEYSAPISGKGSVEYRVFDGVSFFTDVAFVVAPLWTVEAWGENLGGGGDPDAPNWSVECWAVNEPGYAVEAWAVDPEIDHR